MVICQGNLLSPRTEIHHRIQAGLRAARRKRPLTWGEGNLFDATASDHISDECKAPAFVNAPGVTMVAHYVVNAMAVDY